MKALTGKYTVKASNTKGLLDSFVQLLISSRLYNIRGVQSVRNRPSLLYNRPT